MRSFFSRFGSGSSSDNRFSGFDLVFMWGLFRCFYAWFGRRPRRVATDVHSAREQIFVRSVLVCFRDRSGFCGEVFKYLVFGPGVFRIFFPLVTRVSRMQAIAFAAITAGFPFLFSGSLVLIRCVNLRTAIALASAESAITAGFSVFYFPPSVLRFRFSAPTLLLRVRSLTG